MFPEGSSANSSSGFYTITSIIDHGYSGIVEMVEPVLPEEALNFHDCERSIGMIWDDYFCKEMEPGEMCMKAGGKELVIACGYVSGIIFLLNSSANII